MANTISVLYTIEQKRAKKAYNLVQDVDEENIKEYKSAADKFPAMIVNCGLLQALSFYKSKDNLRPVFNALKSWFCEHYSWDADTNFLDKIMKLQVFEYREKTQEALAFSTWLKRFADIKHQGVEDKRRKSKEKEGGKDAS